MPEFGAVASLSIWSPYIGFGYLAQPPAYRISRHESRGYALNDCNMTRWHTLQSLNPLSFTRIASDTKVISAMDVANETCDASTAGAIKALCQTAYKFTTSSVTEVSCEHSATYTDGSTVLLPTFNWFIIVLHQALNFSLTRQVGLLWQTSKSLDSNGEFRNRKVAAGKCAGCWESPQSHVKKIEHHFRGVCIAAVGL